MISIGLTGGMGSGKSTVAELLKHLSYPVFHSDDVGKELLNSDPDLHRDLIALLGEEAYSGSTLQREFVASKLFQDKALIEKMNALVHPRVHEAFNVWKSKQQSPLVFSEAAILFETGSYKRFDDMWLVIADTDVRLERVMKRDGSTKEAALARFSNQMTDIEKLKFNPKVIRNNPTDLLIPQVLELLHI